MSRRPPDVPGTAAALRRLAAALASPCPCDRSACTTIGAHVLQATRDAQPGPRAQNLDPARSTGTATIHLPDQPDPAAAAHTDIVRHLDALARHAIDLELLVTSWAPNRWRPDTVDDNDVWCRHHLDTIGVTEPRFRGDLCRRCYDFQRAQGFPPPAIFLTAWHRGARVTTAEVARVRAEYRNRKRRKRRK